MFCLRSWLPLLFIPTNASPAFIFLFFLCTYFLHRPCVYCSVLLLVLFLTSCNWSDHCFLDYHSNWFLPRALAGPDPSSSSPSPPPNMPRVAESYDAAAAAATALNNSTVQMLGSAARDVISAALDKPEWTGIGLGWLRNLLGRREWQIPSMDICIRL